MLAISPIMSSAPEMDADFETHTDDTEIKRLRTLVALPVIVTLSIASWVLTWRLGEQLLILVY